MPLSQVAIFGIIQIASYSVPSKGMVYYPLVLRCFSPHFCQPFLSAKILLAKSHFNISSWHFIQFFYAL